MSTHNVPQRRVISFVRGALLASLAFLSACGGGGTQVDPGLPAVAIVLESASAAGASVGADGASITATAIDGTTYTLIIPPGALGQTVDIRLTPITGLGDSPLNRGLVGTVRMEPSGLQFLKTATLRIGSLRAPGAGEALVGFGSAKSSDALTLKPAAVLNGRIEVAVSHFSIAGSATATGAEIAALPRANSADLAERFLDELLRLPLEQATDRGTLGAAIADGFRRWYQSHVKPALVDAIIRLDAAPGSVSDVLADPAIMAYRDWIGARAGMEGLTDFSTNANSLLADLDAEARPLVARLLRGRIDSLLAECPRIAKVGVLSFIGYYQDLAVQFVLASTEFGLDNASFLRKVNTCVRPVLDAVRLPTPLVIGTPMSLDAQARLVFNGATDPVGAPFEFTVTATGATLQRSTGKSDAGGRFTTVFTPTGSIVEFQVRACLVLELLSPGQGSDICTTQTVSSVVGETVLSGAVGLETAELFGDGTGGSVSFTGFLRVRVSPDNLVTVIDASGTRRDTSINGNSCLDLVERPILLTTSISYSTTSAGYVLVSPFGVRSQTLSASGTFTFQGVFDGGTEQRLVDGNISCATRNDVISADANERIFLEFQSLVIERDASGRLVAIDLNRTFNAGKTRTTGRLTPNN